MSCKSQSDRGELSLTHFSRQEVLVERWLLPWEIDELQKCKMLGWQSDTEESEVDDHKKTQQIGEARQASAEEQVSITLTG